MPGHCLFSTSGSKSISLFRREAGREAGRTGPSRCPECPEIGPLASVRGWLIHPIFRRVLQLKATNVPGFSNNAPDEFVFSVMQIVKCFSDGLTNGVLPVAGAWLDMIHETYNRNHIEEILDTFKVCVYVAACQPTAGSDFRVHVSIARDIADDDAVFLEISPTTERTSRGSFSVVILILSLMWFSEVTVDAFRRCSGRSVSEPVPA